MDLTYKKLDPQTQKLILDIAFEHDVDPSLVEALIMRESSGNPKARSPKGAMGLMQLMPSTAKEMGVTKPYDVNQNVKGGVKYLSQMLKEFENSETALAAYNAGPTRVKKGRTPRESKLYALQILTHQLLLNERLGLKSPNYWAKGVTQ